MELGSVTSGAGLGTCRNSKEGPGAWGLGLRTLGKLEDIFEDLMSLFGKDNSPFEEVVGFEIRNHQGPAQRVRRAKVEELKGVFLFSSSTSSRSSNTSSAHSARVFLEETLEEMRRHLGCAPSWAFGTGGGRNQRW